MTFAAENDKSKPQIAAEAIYNGIFLPCREASENLESTYISAVAHLRTLSISALLDILEHHYDASFGGEVPFFMSSIFQNNMSLEIKNRFCNEIRSELARRINTLISLPNKEYFSLDGIFTRICLFHNWENHIPKSTKYRLEHKLLDYKIRYAYLHIREVTRQEERLCNIAKDLAACFPDDADDILRFYCRSFEKIVDSNFYSDEHNLLKSFKEDFISAAFDEDLYFTKCCLRSKAPDYEFPFYPKKDDLRSLSDNIFDAVFESVWDIASRTGDKRLMLDMIPHDRDSSLIYFDYYGRLHDRNISAFCPVCDHGIHPCLYGALGWRWWHDSESDFWDGFHRYRDDRLTPHELEQYGYIRDQGEGIASLDISRKTVFDVGAPYHGDWFDVDVFKCWKEKLKDIQNIDALKEQIAALNNYTDTLKEELRNTEQALAASWLDFDRTLNDKCSNNNNVAITINDEKSLSNYQENQNFFKGLESLIFKIFKTGKRLMQHRRR